jgi:hypothetical protein
MLFSCFKRRHSEEEATSSPILKAGLPLGKLVQMVHTVAEERYPVDHIFMIGFLQKFITPDNPQLVKDYLRFQEHLNACRYTHKQVSRLARKWLTHCRSPLETIVQIWKSYLAFEIGETPSTVHEFLVHEIALFRRLIMALLPLIEPAFSDHCDRPRFELELLDQMSQSDLFEEVMRTYIVRYDKAKGINGESTCAEIEETRQQFEKLVRFYELEEPFLVSIQKMEAFHHEHRLGRKLRLMNEAVGSVREQIGAYREQQGMGPAAIGGEEFMPVLNFICEKTGLNILASTTYIAAFVGHDPEYRRELLRCLSC